MGEGWSWSRKQGTEDDHAADAARGLGARSSADLAAEAHRLLRARRVHLPAELGLDRRRRGRRGAAHRPGPSTWSITGRDAPPELVEAADLVTEMTKVKHPMDAGQKGQRGIEW